MRQRAAQIICTIGPASREPETLGRLIDAGMSVARLNFAHGSEEEQRETVARIRAASAERGRPVAILQDLAGPKIRLGQLGGRVELAAEQRVTLNCGTTKGGDGELPVPDEYFADEVRVGGPVLLGDGDVELEVLEVDGSEIHCRVVVGGATSTGKGINAPGGLSKRPLLAAKDRADLALGAELGIDLIGVSYVRTAEDIEQVRGLVKELGRDTPLVAKIETELALQNLDAVLDGSDAVMIARGDLSLEIPYERMPIEQKRIIRAAIRRGRPVITATQMLQSMVSAPRPTRAEISDVANAVLDGTDAVMLSDETAAGNDPVRACRAMSKIADVTHAEQPLREEPPIDGIAPELREVVSFARSAVRTASEVGACALLTWSRGGLAARLLSRQRPPMPIVAATRSEEAARWLGLHYGVRPLECADGRLDRARLEAELGPLPDEAQMLMVGHSTGEVRRIPWMALVRVVDVEDWGIDPRDGRPGGLP